MVVKIETQLTGRLDGSEGFDLFYATTGGIGNATIIARGGSNVVSGNNTQPLGSGIGILNTSISSTGSLTVIANGTTIGMSVTSIVGGDGVDNITARGTLFGVQLVSIDGGGGGDTFDLQSGTGTVNGGSGIDTLVLEGDRSDYTFTKGNGFNNPDNISDANGTNLNVEDIEKFILNGVEFSFDDLFGSGGQNISQAQLTGPFTGTDQDDSYEATTDGIVDASFNTLAGNDTIIGNSANIADGTAILNTTISTGDNDDTITATATGSNSIGLNNVTLQLGTGNDVITARGTLLGVQDVSIDGGAGNDRFDLKNGTGQVIGGDGNDTLTLFGVSSDYTFTGEDGGGQITGANGTDLTVDGIESFQFSEGVFTYDELFNQPVSIIQAQLTGNFDGTNKNDTYFATQSGIVNASFNTKEGSDTIGAFNSNNGGTGISHTSISSGEGNDTIVAMAMGANSIGMDGVTIQGGTGNDVITAQGTLLGVQDVLIDGGEGSDTFDLGSGTGIVVGGLPRSPEIDLLILDGQSLDYTFSGIIELKLGRIINDDLGTNLTVFNVDQFEFNDGTFAFDELFGSTPPTPPDPSVVSIADLEQEEGDSGTTEFVFTVTRSGDISEAVTVNWAVSPAPLMSADANDFVFGAPLSDQVTIAANETSAEFVIQVQGDTDFESDENFIVTLSNPSVGTIGQATATGTIINDDEEPTPPEQGENISRRKIVQQTIEGTDLSDSYQATQDGISASTFETSGGDDLIRGFTADFSDAFSAIGFSEIDTGDGDDMVIAEDNTGSAAIEYTRINTGAGNDEITGMSSTGAGIQNSNIDAGSGEDYILAETEASTFAIFNSVLNGGDGNDTIELRSRQNQSENNGNGTINGGSGDGDLLILGSSSSRYFYELGSSSDLTGTISNPGGTTILHVEGVENFQFANELGTNYTFEQLFGVA